MNSTGVQVAQGSGGGGVANRTPRRVLLAEDEPELARVIQQHLVAHGYVVDVVTSGDAALQAADEGRADLLLLDVMLPGLDGLEVCRRVRMRTAYLPILMLTALSTEVDRVVGLEMGADDYVAKPCSLAELTSRIRAIFRRVEALGRQQHEGVVAVSGSDVRIDPRKREVTLRGTPVALTQKEFDLLLHLARNPGRVYSRAELLEAVWGYAQPGYEHAVNCHVNRLRAKLEHDPADPKLLLTVWGVGYKLAD